MFLGNLGQVSPFQHKISKPFLILLLIVQEFADLKSGQLTADVILRFDQIQEFETGDWLLDDGSQFEVINKVHQYVILIFISIKMKQLLNATLSKVCIFWNIILRYWDPYFCCYLRFHAYCGCHGDSSWWLYLMLSRWDEITGTCWTTKGLEESCEGTLVIDKCSKDLSIWAKAGIWSRRTSFINFLSYVIDRFYVSHWVHISAYLPAWREFIIDGFARN